MNGVQEKVDIIKKLHGSEEKLGILDVKKMLQLRGLSKLNEKEQKVIKEINENIDTTKENLSALKTQMLNEPNFKGRVDKYMNGLKENGELEAFNIDTHSQLDKLMLSLYIQKETGINLDFDHLSFNENNNCVITGVGKKITIQKTESFGRIEITENKAPEEGDTSENQNIKEKNNGTSAQNKKTDNTYEEKDLSSPNKEGTEEETDSKKAPVETLKKTENFIIKNGNIFLVGVDGTERAWNEEILPTQLEAVKGFEKIGLLREVINIWSDKAQKVADGIFWKEKRNDDDIILAQVGEVENQFSILFENIQTQENFDLNKAISEIFDIMQVAEIQEAIIGSKDIERVKEIISGSGGKDEKLKSIYNAMRYGGVSGNSEKVQESVANHLLQDEKFSDVNEILSNPKVLEYIKNNNSTELEKLIGKDLSTSILKSYTKIQVKFNKNRVEYSQYLQKANIERVQNGEDEIPLNDFINSSIDYSISHLLKHALLKKEIAALSNRGNEGTYTGIYADISGLGETKIGDYFNIKDSNIDTAVDVGSTLALSIVSMGVGALAARGALAATSWGVAQGANALNRTQRGAAILNRMNSAGKIGKTTQSIGKFAGVAGIEGVAFYEGTNLMNNIIYGNVEGYNVFENAGNKKEILKSIAFMGALKGASQVLQRLGSVKGISGLTEKVPNNIIKAGKPTLEILTAAGLITGTSVAIEASFEGDAEWTWGEYLQAIAMVTLFKGAGKVKFTKTGEGIKVQLNRVKEGAKWAGNKTGELGKNTFQKTKEGTRNIKKAFNTIKKKAKGTKFTLETNNSSKVQELKSKIGVIEQKIEHFNGLKRKHTNNLQESERYDGKIKKLQSEKEELQKQISNLKKEKQKQKAETQARDEKIKSKIFEGLKKSPEFLKMIDKRLSNLPLGLKKPYNFSKFVAKKLTYNETKGDYRFIIKEMGTPIRVVKGFKEAKTVNEHIKNVLFANKDITVTKGVVKMAGYAVIPIGIEELVQFQDQKENFHFTLEDFALDYVSNMYLGVVNSLIYEYLNSKFSFLPGE